MFFIFRLDVVHPFSGVLVLAHADDLRVLGLDASWEAEDDFIFEMKGLQDPLQRLVGDLGPLPLREPGMRQVVEHLPTHGIHVLLPDPPIDVRDLSQELASSSE